MSSSALHRKVSQKTSRVHAASLAQSRGQPWGASSAWAFRVCLPPAAPPAPSAWACLPLLGVHTTAAVAAVPGRALSLACRGSARAPELGLQPWHHRPRGCCFSPVGPETPGSVASRVTSCCCPCPASLPAAEGPPAQCPSFALGTPEALLTSLCVWSVAESCPVSKQFHGK